MYTNVHMPTTIPITDFRKDIFDLAIESERTGQSFSVLKNNKIIWNVVPVRDDMAARATYALRYVLPKAGGMWKNKTKKEMKLIRSVRNGPLEKKYLDRYNE